MPVESVCLNCGATLRVGIQAIGQTLPCKECGNGIFIEDPTKPKQKGLSPPNSRGISTEVPQETQNTGFPVLGCVVLLGITGAIVMGVCGLGNRLFPDPPASPYGDELTAKVMCEDFVLPYLNFPDEAEFPWREKRAAFDSDLKTWLVSGVVKAKNAFGVTSSIPFVVELHVVSEGSNHWRKRMVVLKGKTVYDSESKPQ